MVLPHLSLSPYLSQQSLVLDLLDLPSAGARRGTSGQFTAGECRDSDHVYLDRVPLHYCMARCDSDSISPSPDRGEQGNSSGTPNRNEPRGSLTP